MQTGVPEKLLLVAGHGSYPQCLFDGARKAGVRHIVLAAVRGMTSRRLAAQADEVEWIGIGEFEKFLRLIDQAARRGVRHVALAGQITPAVIFHPRMDQAARDLLRSIPLKNAHTVFGRISDILASHGLQTLPASCFMDDCLPLPGVLTQRAPTAQETNDIEIGHRIAMTICGLDIGQTVVVKDGMILAVEGFDGTNATILRGGKLGGRGVVVVKVAKDGHDMRFDIPVIGAKTIPVLKKARVTAIAFQARRTVLLERDEVIAAANRLHIAMIALDSGLPPAPTRIS
jgi:hypothetical protein